MRILPTIAKLHNIHTKSIDFVQAYPQATLNRIFIHIRQQEYYLSIETNVYGPKDANKTWLEHLTEGLYLMRFKPLSSDPCIYVKGSNMIIVYVDDCIIIFRNNMEANEKNQEIDKRGYKLTDEGTMEECLGILITHEKNRNYRISQPLTIYRIIKSVPSMKGEKGAKTPTTAGNVLTKDTEGETRKEHWSYRFVIGTLNFLVNCTHPEMAFAVHQCARFCNNPKYSHVQARKKND